MIRLTVLYDLPLDADEREFLDWRLTEHQENNESMPGVLHTDFGVITHQWPEGSMPNFRFQTTVEWADRRSFEGSFYEDSSQRKLKENLQRLGHYSFFVSEILTGTHDPSGT